MVRRARLSRRVPDKVIATLVQVFCRNPFCPFYMNKGKRALVGRISDRAELKCHSCRQVDTYEV